MLVADALLRRGATVDAVDAWGRTALARAVAESHSPDLVRLLLRSGAQRALIGPELLAVARLTSPECARALDESISAGAKRMTEFWRSAEAVERAARQTIERAESALREEAAGGSKRSMLERWLSADLCVQVRDSLEADHRRLHR